MMVRMHHGVPFAPRNQPAADWEGRSARNQQRNGERSPKQPRGQPRLHGARDDNHDRVIDEFHDQHDGASCVGSCIQSDGGKRP